MPGERLMCVWAAACSRTRDSTNEKLTKVALHDLIGHLGELPSINYTKSKFENNFKSDKDVTLAAFNRFLFEVLAESGMPQCVVQEEVEDKCWELCKSAYKYKILTEDNIKKLWKIGNRLADVDSFPPKINSGAADWFIDKVCSHLGKNWLSKSERPEESYTFSALLDRLVEDFFSGETKEAVTACINELYSWLVLEIMKSGWLFKRTRKQANWTNWIKRWFVLSSTRLCYYDNQNCCESGKLRGEVFLTGSKVEALGPYKGLVHKLNGRFKVSNLPYIEIELALNSVSQRRSWISSIEDVIDASKNKTTPIQRLLNSRWGKGSQGSSNRDLDKSELRNAGASPIAHPETVVQIRKQSNPMVHVQKISQGSTGSDDESFDNIGDSSLIKETNEKIKAVFMRIDADGNGKIDENEFRKFISGLGLKIKDREINMLYKSVAKANGNFITFQEFSDYFANVLLDENVSGEAECKLRGAFLAADRDGTGTLNFKEFAEYLWDKKRSIRMSKLFTAFDEMDIESKGQVSYDQFRDFYKNRMSAIPEVASEEYKEEEQALNAVDQRLKEFYQNAEADELAHFIRERWNKFATFKRYGASGQIAMTGGHGMVNDIVPGDYSLLELACFSDLPPLVPKYTSVKGIRWETSKSPGTSGKLIFPSDFDGVLVRDTATPEHLRYYGCSFAEGNQLKISLLYRHGIQDFTYENQYLEDYVTLSNGGSGVEKHEFSHLDCPLEENSGDFILAKLVGEDELHLTAFHVPVRHTLYIPANVIHSNDYLRGTWRTMLSDEADIDHVHLVKLNDRHKVEHFKFKFAA